MSVVVIIPAYNEEATIAAVIRTAREVEEVDQVIVISDGSTDRTAQVAREAGADCIELEQNVGKGGALKAGIDRADAEIFVFLDADLIGLKSEHIRQLLRPVYDDEADMTIGLFEGGRLTTDLAQVVAPYLSGQRAVKREVLQAVSGLDMARFGVEVAIHRYIRDHRVRVVEVILPHVTHRMKEEKLGILRGFLARMKMYWEIVKYTQKVK